MATGQLSYAKVRALTRVATPATESVLLNVAVHGTAHHVERLVRHFRRVLEVEELSREARQQEHRAVRYHYDADGSLVLEARLPAEAGALLLKALEAAMPEAPRDVHDSQDFLHVSAETRRCCVNGQPPSQRGGPTRSACWRNPSWPTVPRR